ncbi:urea ABC transporter permease subunit UrtB [Neptunicella sp. SCSIO 80796]|uniref:urea ABC transporter permease subunit UrtB n=1 Tax=Neptunicella plasticusilytica TaxID=3117012 RepID=UPI003A4DF777
MCRLYSYIIGTFLCSMLCWISVADATVADSPIDLPTLVAELPQAGLKEMPSLTEKLADSGDPRVRNIFKYLLEGDLYYVKSDKRVVWVQRQPDGLYALQDILSDEQLTPQPKSAITKIRTNNNLRSQLRGLLAQIDFTHPDANVRLQAVKQILDNPDEGATRRLQYLIGIEQNDDVKQLMNTAIAVRQLKTGNSQQKRAAIKIVTSSLEPSVKNVMAAELRHIDKDDTELKQALEGAIDRIENKRAFYEFIENVFFGLSLGSVLLLAAIGLAITFGVMGVINMAHGEMIMLGAYTTYAVQQFFPELLTYSLLIAVPAAFVVSGGMGVVIERCVIRFLKGRPLETLLATFGISLILQQLVRSVFSPLNRQVNSPDWMSGSWQINPIFSLTYNRLYILLFSLAVFFILMLIMNKTSLGLHVRAVSQNRQMARALSIRSNRVDAITFGLGSGIAGIAGVVLSQLTNVGPNMGQSYIIDSFLVVVFGGVGNLWGTLLAAMSLGSINKFLEPLTGSVLASILVLIGLILFMQKRPQGLFPLKGRAAES